MPEMTAAEAAEHVARIAGASATTILADAFTAGCEAMRASQICDVHDIDGLRGIAKAREVLRQHHAALSANAGSEAKR